MRNENNSVKDNWPVIKVKLKEKYPQLTEGDLKYEDGYEHELFQNLQMKTGNSREELLIVLNKILGDD